MLFTLPVLVGSKTEQRTRARSGPTDQNDEDKSEVTYKYIYLESGASTAIYYDSPTLMSHERDKEKNFVGVFTIGPLFEPPPQLMTRRMYGSFPWPFLMVKFKSSFNLS